MKKRNSYTVQFASSSFGQIEFYAVVPGKDELLYVAFVLPLPNVPSSGLHLGSYELRGLVDKIFIPVQKSTTTVVVPITQIYRKCLYIEIDSPYVCILPNTYEKD